MGGRKLMLGGRGREHGCVKAICHVHRHNSCSQALQEVDLSKLHHWIDGECADEEADWSRMLSTGRTDALLLSPPYNRLHSNLHPCN